MVLYDTNRHQADARTRDSQGTFVFTWLYFAETMVGLTI